MITELAERYVGSANPLSAARIVVWLMVCLPELLQSAMSYRAADTMEHERSRAR